MAVIIVDTAERVQAFIPELDELITEGLVIIDDVEVITYVGREPGEAHDIDRSGEDRPR